MHFICDDSTLFDLTSHSCIPFPWDQCVFSQFTQSHGHRLDGRLMAGGSLHSEWSQSGCPCVPHREGACHTNLQTWRPEALSCTGAFVGTTSAWNQNFHVVTKGKAAKLEWKSASYLHKQPLHSREFFCLLPKLNEIFEVKGQSIKYSGGVQEVGLL